MKHHLSSRRGSVMVVMIGLSTILLGLTLTLYLQTKAATEGSRTYLRQTQAFIMAQAMIAYAYPYWDKNRVTTFESYPSDKTFTADTAFCGGVASVRSLAFTLVSGSSQFPTNITRARWLGQAYYFYNHNSGMSYIAGISGSSYTNGDPATASPAEDGLIWFSGKWMTGPKRIEYKPYHGLFTADSITLPSSPTPPGWRAP